MNPRVIAVKVADNYQLLLEFTNKETKLFDVKPYLEFGIFKELKDLNYFNQVIVDFGTVSWNDRQDFCPDTLYLESKTINN